MTGGDYADQVRTALGARATRAELDAVADLRTAIAEWGVADPAAVVAEFGTAQEYAERLRAALGSEPRASERAERTGRAS
jgi:hypothetical protein